MTKLILYIDICNNINTHALFFGICDSATTLQSDSAACSRFALASAQCNSRVERLFVRRDVCCPHWMFSPTTRHIATPHFIRRSYSASSDRMTRTHARHNSVRSCSIAATSRSVQHATRFGTRAMRSRRSLLQRSMLRSKTSQTHRYCCFAFISARRSIE